MGHVVAQLAKALGYEAAGSIPYEADFFNLPNPSILNMALGSIQPLREMSIRNLPGG
jgi:hypothetical protein